MTTLARPDVLTGYTAKVQSPDGTLFVTVCESQGKSEFERNANEVHLHIGKSGASVQAWAEAVARVTTLALRAGVPLESIIEEVSNIATDRISPTGGARSGPEAFGFGLLRFARARYLLLKKEQHLGVDKGEARLG